jgi:hypothetical protein
VVHEYAFNAILINCSPFLHLPHFRIPAMGFKQLDVGTTLNDLTLLHHQNLIGMGNGRESVGNNQGSSVAR